MEEIPEEIPVTSKWPILLASGLALIVIGIISTLIVSVIGVVVLLVALAGWTQENRAFAQRFETDAEGEEESGDE